MTDKNIYQKLLLQKTPQTFYLQTNVINVAKQLLGKLLVTYFNKQLTVGIITETEAYEGITDKASHAYNNKRTQQTEIMYAQGGVAYVYLCYGMHHLFNVVCNSENIPHAVLIRAIQPFWGLSVMANRTKKINRDISIGVGPGNVSKALGISKEHNCLNLLGNEVFIAENELFSFTESNIICTKRIGVDYAKEHALLPYRFLLKDNLHVSGNKRQNIAIN